MPDEDRTEQEQEQERETEPEPSLVERQKEEEKRGGEEGDRPTDYALGRELTELRRDVDGLKASHESLSQELREAVSTMPDAIQASVERAILSLQADETEAVPLETNPALKPWEKILLGRR